MVGGVAGVTPVPGRKWRERPMAQPISITFQMLQDGNKACTDTIKDVDDTLGRMRADVSELAGQWLGASSVQYQNLMTDFDKYGQMLNDSLQGIADGLMGNYHNYTTTEVAIEQSLLQVNGVIPGANLG
jgi:WXG100 family type VII secretion target